MSALKLCKRSKGLDTGNKEQVLIHLKTCSLCQQRSAGCFCLYKESMCAEDTDAALWELGNLRVFEDLQQQPKEPTVSNFCLCIAAVHIGVTQSNSMLAIP